MSAVLEPSSQVLAGRHLGRYQVLSRLAAGGMATVYVARAQGVAGFERLLAIKVLHPHLALEHDFVTMFLDEARLAARIRHPNVVATLDISTSDANGYFLVMEYVEGEPLNTVISNATRRGEMLPVPVTLRIVLDALAGLDAAHSLLDERGQSLRVVHRDVSPQNILVGVDGVSKLTDFGVAKADARITSTREGQIKGKLSYMAPEQVESGYSDQRSDLFAVGVVLWEALTGRRLFRSETQAAVVKMILTGDIPGVSDVRRDLGAIEPVLRKALARDANDRYFTAAEFSEAIEAVAPALGGIASAREVSRVLRHLVGERIDAQRGAIQAAIDASGRMSDPAAITVPSDRGGPAGDVDPDLERTASVTLRTGETGVRDAATHGTTRRGPKLLGAIVVCMIAIASLAGWRVWHTRVHTRVSPPAVARNVTPSPPEDGVFDANALTGPGDVPPRLVEGVPPPSPDPSATFVPSIVCRVLVDPAGHPREAHVVHPRSELAAFERMAVAAVQHYRFDPARHTERSVAAWVNVAITFASQSIAHTLRVRGSETIGRTLAPQLAEAFRLAHADTAIEVQALGSATGFAALFDGNAEIGASSRPVSESELAEARRLGVALQEFVIGYDGVAFVVNAANPVRDLSLEQVSQILSGTVRDWHDVGGEQRAIRLFGRPSYSGTHAFVLERVLRHGNAHGPEQFATGIEEVERNEDVVARITADPGAIGYVPFSFATGQVRAIALRASPDAEPLAPTPQTIQDGTYPASRPLFFYTRGAPQGAVADFLRFVLSDDAHPIVVRNGFVPSDMSPDLALHQADAAGGGATLVRAPVRILFDIDHEALVRASRHALDRLVAEAAHGSVRVVLIGNADGAGELRRRPSIARDRAQAVAHYLQSNGVAEDRLRVESADATHPLGSNDDEAGRTLNRRVDVFVVQN